MWFNQYPYLNLNDLNLDFILKAIKDLKYEVENFVSINAIKYADPIQWDITRQYEKNTIVIDPLTGTAYISVAAVPAGVALNRPEYWSVVFDLQSFVTKANKNFTDHYEDGTTLTATFPSSVGDWLVWGDVLFEVISPITAGDQYVINSNIKHFTIEDIYKAYLNTIANIAAEIDDITNNIGNLDDLNTSDKSSVVNAINSVLSLSGCVVTAEMYGAAGDGTTDDTAAIINALANANTVICDGIYRTTSAITVPKGKNIIGYGRIVADYSNGYFDVLTLKGDNIISNLSFTDNGATLETGYNIIYGEDIDNIIVNNCVFNDIHAGYCIEFVHSDHLTITHNRITNYSYSGIMLINGCHYCDVSYNYIYNARINYTNKYPISLSGYFLEATRPAKYITCNYNHIEDVSPVWEGIDSHSIENAEIIGNYIANVRSGIVLSSPSTPVLQSGLSIRGVIVKNNVILVEAYDGVMNGIVCSINDQHGRGAITGVEISNNYISGTGTPSYSTSIVSGIAIRTASRDVSIRNNEIVGDWNGISLADSPTVNVLIEHNTIRSSTLAGTSAIRVDDLTGVNDMVQIVNNVFTGNVADVTAPTSIVRGLIRYNDNLDDGVYNNTDFITTPRATAPSSTTKAKGRQGDFIPCNTSGTIAGWLCVAAASWVSLDSTSA